MSTTFRRINPVMPGDKITSAQRNGMQNHLADGINDRLRSGLGCGTFRMQHEAYAATRDVLQNNGDAFPEKDVWLKAFAQIPYGDADAQWPGDDQSVNPLSPLMAFIVGCDVYNLTEEARLNVIEAAPFTTALEAWNAGKQQRGYIDLDTGAENSPSFNAARFQRSIPAGEYPFLVKYGGWMPTPPAAAPCFNGDPRSLYTFTPLRAGLPLLNFFTVCNAAVQDDTEGDGLTSVEELDDGYRLTFQFSPSQKLLYTDYVFGPLTGPPQLRFTASDAIEHIMFRFAADFRGTSAERADDAKYRVAEVSFDFQKFLASQYLLAPAQATDNGAGGLTPTGYPQFSWDVDNAEDQPFTIRAGYTLAGYRLKTTLAPAPVTIQLQDAADPTNIFLTINAPSGTTETFVWLPKLDGTPGAIKLVVSHAIESFGGEARVELELAVLEQTKPSLNDAYVLLRRSSTDGEKEFDNRGRDFPSAPKISADYFQHGCIFAKGDVRPQLGEPVNTNPMHDAAREIFRKRMRFVKRESFRGYAVENGKSVLWFDRQVNVGGKSFDIFDGLIPIVKIAPPNGLTNEWLMFISTNAYSDSDSSAFKDDNYGAIDVFLHNRCHLLSEELLGEPELFAHLAPGQFPIAPPIYTPAASSDNYINGLNSVPLELDDTKRGKFFQSCPIYPPDYEVESAELTTQSIGPNLLDGIVLDGSGHSEPVRVVNGQSYLWSPGASEVLYSLRGETVTAVAPGSFIGQDYVVVDFGPPDTTAPGSVTAYIPGGEVKLTFKTRFRNTGEVGGDIARGNYSGYTGYAYRTDENALIAYLSGAVSPLIGDAAELQDLSTFPLNGSVQPRFYFTQLMPKVWEETPDTDTQDARDTRCFSEDLNYAYFILQATCEGFIDPLAQSVVQNCGARPGQYTFQSLCYQIDGTFTRWQMMRADVNGGKGFGPVPNTIIYANMFNNLARGFNLLTRVPVELPFTAFSRARDYTFIADWGLADLHQGTVPNGDNCDKNPPEPHYQGAPYLVGSNPKTPADDDAYVAGVASHLLNVEAHRSVNLVASNYLGGGELPVMNCATKSFQSQVNERKFEVGVSFDTRCVLGNLAGLFETSASINVRKFSSFQWNEQAAQPSALFGLPDCGTGTWPSYTQFFIRRMFATGESCLTLGASDLNSANFILSADPFHAGVYYWSLGPCDNSPLVSTSINVGVNVLIATVPLV